MAATVKTKTSTTATSGVLSTRAVLKSFALHVLAMALMMLVPAEAMNRSTLPKEVDVTFYKPRPVEIPGPVVPPPPPREAIPAPPAKKPGGPPPSPVVPPAGPPVAENPATPGPEGPPMQQESPREKAGKSGILAYRDQFARLGKDKPGPRLGADARYSVADNTGRGNSSNLLTTNAPGSSRGISYVSLSRNVGGSGGGGAGGEGGMEGVEVGRATSSIAGIGGGDRPLSHGGPGPSRTDEEIQIVFDRHKAAFYRLYNRELRKTPTLKGQMVLRLTIEPDGSVSMCVLQSSDMDAPDLAAQVVERVKTIDFGAKEGVQALTIVYPIDFLPAE